MRDVVTILVLEPHPITLDTISTVLEIKGYRVLRASTRTDALSLCQNAVLRIDLLVTDTAISEAGGAAGLYELIREVNPDLPALFISGHERNELIARGWLPPGAPFMQKPFTAQSLYAEVGRLLSGSETRSAQAD